MERLIQVEDGDTFPVVCFYGEFDLADVAEIDKTLSLYDGAPVLTVSLEEALFIDSTVLGALVRCYNRRSGRLVIIVPRSSAVYRLFAISALLEHFFVVNDRAEALRRVATLREEIA